MNPAFATLDFDRDGRLDMFLSEFRSVFDLGVVPSLLMRNEGLSGNWLDVQVNAGVNRFGIGTKVRVYKEGMGGVPAGLIGFAEITTGFGFSSSASRGLRREKARTSLARYAL